MLPEGHCRECVCTLWQRFAVWCKRDSLYRELAALDARGLHDIGITPADIPAIVKGTYQRGGAAEAGKK